MVSSGNGGLNGSGSYMAIHGFSIGMDVERVGARGGGDNERPMDMARWNMGG